VEGLTKGPPTAEAVSDSGDGLAAIAVAETALCHLLGTISSRLPSTGRTRSEHTRRTLIGLANSTYRGLAVFGGGPGVHTAYDIDGRYQGGIGDCRWSGGVTTPCGPVVFGVGTQSLFAVVGRVLQAASDQEPGTSLDAKALAVHVRHVASIRSSLELRRELLVRRALDVEVESVSLQCAENQLRKPIPSTLAIFLA
jgi:hypothetical protein